MVFRHRPRCTHQRGSTVLITMTMLTILMFIGLTLAELTLLNESVVRNRRDRMIALQAAGAALADAELDIEHAGGKSSRSHLFAAQSSLGFGAGCARGRDNIYQGLCQTSPAGAKPVWQTVDIGDDRGYSASVQYGRFTDRTLPTGAGPFPKRLPRYLIELLPDHRYTDLFGPTEHYFYRITAIGFGTDQQTQVVLQSVYRKSSATILQESGQ